MNTEIKKKFRYPGLSTFSSCDHDIFCGRIAETRKLYYRLLINNTVVLHGESGTGKSSLVQAGLLPFLEEQNLNSSPSGGLKWLPITVRMDTFRMTGPDKAKEVDETRTDFLVRQVFSEIKQNSRYPGAQFPLVDPKECNFWYLAKQFEKAGYTLLLVFDQFEELQRFSGDQTDLLAKRLSELSSKTVPDSLYSGYEENTARLINQVKGQPEEYKRIQQEISFMERQVVVKMLFIVREDKLGTMSLLADYFPDILKNDLILMPLDRSGAKMAIENPAALQDPQRFETDAFHFNPEAIKKLLEILADPSGEMFDPIQLQIVCSNIERKVANRKSIITPDDIPPVVSIINDFYAETWETIRKNLKCTDSELEKKRREIIDKLVVDNRRNIVLKQFLVEEYDTRGESIIESIVTAGFLRKIVSGTDTYYQVSHDRLMLPVNQDKMRYRALKENEEKNRKKAAKKRKQAFLFLGIITAVLAVSLALTGIFYKKSKDAEHLTAEDKYILISKALFRLNNPTLSYIVAADWFKDNPGSQKMAEYLKTSFGPGFYLKGIYPSLYNVDSASLISDDTLKVYENNRMAIWDLKSMTLVNSSKISNGEPIGLFNTSVGQIRAFWKEISDNSGKVLLVNANNDTISRIPYQAPWSPAIIELSEDCRFIMLNGTIFRVTPPMKVGNIPLYKSEEFREESDKAILVLRQIFSGIFLDNYTMAISYNNGDIVLYRIDEAKNPRVFSVDTLDTFYNSDHGERYRILLYNKRYKILLATNNDNGIEVFDISNLDMGTGNDKNSAHMFLTGHTDNIRSMVFSTDNRYLLTGGNDRMVILWDILKRKKVQTMKVPAIQAIKFVSFSGSDANIIAISSNNFVYLWKKGEAGSLYREGLLYRFSKFNYNLWGLVESNTWYRRTSDTTLSLYSSLIDQLVNMPASSEFPEDKSYTNCIRNSADTIRVMYNRLYQRKDFLETISPYQEALLEKSYAGFQLRLVDLLQKRDTTPLAELYVLNGKILLASYKQYFVDTTIKRFELTRLHRNISLLLDTKKDTKGAERLIRFYDDSILNPLTARYGGSRRAIKYLWMEIEQTKSYFQRRTHINLK